MNFPATEAVIVLVAIGCWIQAKRNSKLSLPERMAGYTYSMYFICLAGVIYLSQIRLALSAKASAIAAVGLLGLGVFGRHHSKDPNIEPRLAQFEEVFSGDIILLAVALGLTSVVLWVISLLRR
jgi:hypothetical protein